MSFERDISDISCAILAGGKNTRMNGSNKAFLLIDNKPILRIIIDVIKEIFNEIILVTNSPQDYAMFKRELLITTDLIRDVGPLGGIHAALSVTSKRAVFFVACDMPFLHNGIIRRQLKYFSESDCDALIPKIADSIEPLHAIYSAKLCGAIKEYIKQTSEYSVINFLKTIDAAYYELPDTQDIKHMFSNINTLDDLKIIGRYEGEIKGLAR